MKVFMFHLMPYAYLDMSFSDKYRSAWVVLPNTYFDPKKGHELYNRYLDELRSRSPRSTLCSTASRAGG